MQRAKLGQHCSDLGARVTLGAGAERSAHLSLHMCEDLQEIDGYQCGCNGPRRNAFQSDIARQFPTECLQHGLRRREILGHGRAEIRVVFRRKLQHGGSVQTLSNPLDGDWQF